MSWDELERIQIPMPDRVNGPTNAQALLRLFGRPESEVRVTLYRDHHSWCPFCQKGHRSQQPRRSWAEPPCGTCL
jgi:glutathione S-transferase